MYEDAGEKVLKAIEKDGRPKTANDIAEITNLSMPTVSRILSAFIGSRDIICSESSYVMDGKITKVRLYSILKDYNANNETENFSAEFEHFQQTVLDAQTKFEGITQQKIAEYERINNETTERTKRIYTDIIALMGIFVAVFALIVINVEAIQGAISAADCIWISFGKLLLLNFPLVLAIAALMFLIKYFLLKPLCENKDKTCAKEVVEDGEQETH